MYWTTCAGWHPNGLGGYVQDYRYQYNAIQRLTRIDNELGAVHQTSGPLPEDGIGTAS